MPEYSNSISDFRGFLFSEEQPGIRVFGNLRSNRLNYNLAYFYFLEKDTNSGLNTFNQRHQQVYVANLYIQDFLTKGYTTEFSFHYNRDDPSLHYDENGFLVRPAPIGDVVNGDVIEHGIRAYYLGWTGNGHIKRMNVSNAFYQALGHDTFNPIAGRPVNIDAQMAAVELSVDKDWVRYYTSFFYASGDGGYRFGRPQRHRARIRHHRRRHELRRRRVQLLGCTGNHADQYGRQSNEPGQPLAQSSKQ